jgi:DNA-binding winged helix-turn-helix (wHTH) protein/Tol biopolymer transport system component
MTAMKSFVFSFEDIEVHEREFRLTRSGEVLQVEPKAFKVLVVLLKSPQRLITKEELLNSVWGDASVTENSLTRSILKLRRVLEDDVRNPRFIETVATVGYRWVCPVEVTELGAETLEPVALINTTGRTAVAEPAVAAVGPILPPDQPVPVSEKMKRARFVRRGIALAAGALAGLGCVVWYLHRPLPPPHISSYTQITSDGRPKILGGADGSRLYFTLMPSTGLSPHSLAEVSATGGEIAQIPIDITGGLFLAVDVSRDGSSALIASVEKGITPFAFWNASLVGGSLKRLLHSAQGAAYSPDGKLVAYTTEAGELWIMGSDGTGPHRMGSVGAGGAYMPAWSPDGSTISFQRGNRIWEVAANGSNPHQLLPGWHDAEGQCCGHWTADGKFFLFASGELWGERGQLWALDERRGLLRRPPAEPIQLTLGPTRWGTPISSRDGKTIFAEGTSPRGELSRYDAQSKQFHPFLNGISAEGVAFSQDGKSMVYVSFPGGILWRANRDGSNPVQLSQPPMHPMNPRWSPDGKQIVFTDVAPFQYESYIVPAEGGGPRRLLPEGDGPNSDPGWSPDGKKIVVEVSLPNTNDESGLRILEVASGKISEIPGSIGMSSPRWSPDGRKIAALTEQTNALRFFDTESRQWTAPVAKDGVQAQVFSADSQFLYYLVLGSDQAVYRVHIKGGDPELVVDLKDWHMTGHFDFWLGLDPTNAPLLLRNNGSSDLFALTLEDK